jgi:hypothetical protein
LNPKGEEIFEARGESTEYPVSLWPWLSGLVLILYIADILLRRVRLLRNGTRDGYATA